MEVEEYETSVRREVKMEIDDYQIYENGHVLLIDGLTIIKFLWVGFSYPPSYKYRVEETGQIFFSSHADILEAYMKKRGTINSK